MIKIFYDTETTGTNYKLNSIHQLAGIIEIDGDIIEEFDFRMRPHEKAIITPEALKVCNKTLEEILAYPSYKETYRAVKKMLDAYIDRYDAKNKAKLIGFNNRSFDDDFFRMFFELCGDTFFNSYFWSDSIDVLVLASHYLEDRRPEMPTFKLKRVALELGITYDKSELHGAPFDAMLTRQIYRIVTGIDLEI